MLTTQSSRISPISFTAKKLDRTKLRMSVLSAISNCVKFIVATMAGSVPVVVLHCHRLIEGIKKS